MIMACKARDSGKVSRRGELLHVWDGVTAMAEYIEREES